MRNSPPKNSAFDVDTLISQAFRYAPYLRLMVILATFGILSGVIYFVYTKAIYQSRSVIYFRAFSSPIQDRDLPEIGLNQNGLSRRLPVEFNSQRNIVGAAKRIGAVGPNGVWEDVQAVMPSILAFAQDQNHLEVIVKAYNPEFVRRMPEALVEEYRAYQKQAWKEYRSEAMGRYAEEMVILEGKVSDSIAGLSRFEREKRLAEAAIEQSSLTEIPKDLVMNRERLVRMNAVHDRLQKFEDIRGSGGVEKSYEETIMLLSLLSSAEREKQVNVGDMVRRSDVKSPLRLRKDGEKEVDVVVQPSMVDGLEPWRVLEKEKRTLDEKISEASKTYLPEHEVMKALLLRRTEVQRSLESELKVMRERFDLDRVRVEEKLASLEARLPEYHKATEEFGKSASEYTSLEKGQTFWDKARERLTDKLAVMTFAEDSDWVDVQFKGFTSLRDVDPVSPSKAKLVMVAIAVALAGAIGVPTVLTLLNTKVSNLDALEDQTGLTGIGIVPLVSQGELEEVHRSPAQGALVPNSLLENFRVIRSSICLRPNRNRLSQVVMVTSARPREGKTSQAANLAWAFHSLGERTLLVDCDLRRGRVHKLTEVSNEPGLTSLLLGHCSPEEAIQKTSVDMLDVLPRGPVIAGTTEILCQKRFEDLITQFRQEYGRIILDTPPVLGLSEAASLPRIADGVVLVVRAEATPRRDVADAVELLRKSGAHFFGAVLNAVDLSKLRHYYKYYYYSSGYYDQFEEPVPDALNRRLRSKDRALVDIAASRGHRPPNAS